MFEMTAHGFNVDYQNTDSNTVPVTADLTLVFKYTDAAKEAGIRKFVFHYFQMVDIPEDRIHTSVVEKP